MESARNSFEQEKELGDLKVLILEKDRFLFDLKLEKCKAEAGYAASAEQFSQELA